MIFYTEEKATLPSLRVRLTDFSYKRASSRGSSSYFLLHVVKIQNEAMWNNELHEGDEPRCAPCFLCCLSGQTDPTVPCAVYLPEKMRPVSLHRALNLGRSWTLSTRCAAALLPDARRCPSPSPTSSRIPPQCSAPCTSELPSDFPFTPPRSVSDPRRRRRHHRVQTASLTSTLLPLLAHCALCISHARLAHHFYWTGSKTSHAQSAQSAVVAVLSITLCC